MVSETGPEISEKFHTSITSPKSGYLSPTHESRVNDGSEVTSNCNRRSSHSDIWDAAEESTNASSLASTLRHGLEGSDDSLADRAEVTVEEPVHDSSVLVTEGFINSTTVDSAIDGSEAASSRSRRRPPALQNFLGNFCNSMCNGCLRTTTCCGISLRLPRRKSSVAPV